MFEICILGTNSAVPAFGRHPTAQMLTHMGTSFLLDCGEGTQLQAARYGQRLRKLEAIFITHLHGDHVLGLVGILTTLSLGGRPLPLTLVGPVGIRAFVEYGLAQTYSTVRYPIEFVELDNPQPGQEVYRGKRMMVSALPLSHRVPTVGYLFTEIPARQRFLFYEAKRLGVPKEKMGLLKLGNPVTLEDGFTVLPEQVLAAPDPPRRYAFCTDTGFLPELAGHIAGVDLLYHESTFLQDQEQRARDTFHSTAADAARIARQAGVGKLLLGHYSARYKELQPFLDEARRVFPHTELALEGQLISIPLNRAE
ncbi:MAG: ribonuclease Z [Bacteroidetes bacterium]|nr:ribonuclease Z [Bacteroidota bacterium]